MADIVSLGRASASSSNYIDIEFGQAAAVSAADTLAAALRAIGTPAVLHIADLGVTLDTGVSAWADQSGVGDTNRNLTQATAGVQPVYTASDAQFNNRGVLDFNGSKYIKSGTWSAALAHPCTYYFVQRQDSSVGSQVFHFNHNGSGSYHYFISTATNMFVQTLATTSLTGATALGTSKARLICIVINGASSAHYIDDMVTPVTTGNTGSTASVGETLGATNSGSSAYMGRLGARAAYSGAHDATARSSVGTLLRDYYALTGITV